MSMNIAETKTADDVAKVLNVSRQRVYELVRRGFFPPGVAVRLGKRQIRFNEEALREWLRGGGQLSSTSGQVEQASV